MISFFIGSKYTLKGYLLCFLYSYQHGSGQICLFFYRCMLLLQQSKSTTVTVQNIFMFILRADEMCRGDCDYCESAASAAMFVCPNIFSTLAFDLLRSG